MGFLLDDPKQTGLLSLGLRLMSTPGRFTSALGQAGMGALGDYQAAAQQQRQNKRADLQESIMLMQLAQAQRKAEAQREAEAKRAGFLNSIDPNAGPAMPFSPAAAMGAGLGADEIKALQGSEPQLMNVAPGGSVFDPKTRQPLFQAPFKPAEPPQPPSSIREYEYAKSQGYKGTFEQWDRDSKKAGATSVSVNANQPLPAGVTKQQDDMIERLTVARSIDADLGAIQQQIQAGQLKFGPVRNLVNQGKNMAGMSDEESRRFASFKSSLEKLRNDSLRLNSGVQTEGDAQRAWNELFQSINDTDFVNARLAEIRKINQRAAQLQQYRLQVLRENFGAQPLPSPTVEPALPAPQARPSIDDLLRKYGKP